MIGLLWAFLGVVAYICLGAVWVYWPSRRRPVSSGSSNQGGRMTTEAELSRLLFNAREIVAMYHDVVRSQTGQVDDWTQRTRDQLDAYRAERGWSPDGFGGES